MSSGNMTSRHRLSGECRSDLPRIEVMKVRRTNGACAADSRRLFPPRFATLQSAWCRLPTRVHLCRARLPLSWNDIRRVRVPNSEDSAVLKLSQNLAGESFRAVATANARNNCRSERRATIVDFSYAGCGIRTVVESCRGADLQGLCASSVRSFSVSAATCASII